MMFHNITKSLKRNSERLKRKNKNHIHEGEQNKVGNLQSLITNDTPSYSCNLLLYSRSSP